MSKRTVEPVSITSASVSELLREFLVRLGEDPERDGLQRTPERMERAFQYLTKGYKEDAEKILRGAQFEHPANLIENRVDFGLSHKHMRLRR